MPLKYFLGDSNREIDRLRASFAAMQLPMIA